MRPQHFLKLCAAALVAAALVAPQSLVFARPAGAAAPPRQTQAAAPPRGVERVTSVEGITEYRLPNGLRVLLFPDQSKQTITVNITYFVGSRHENYGETGMAHLLEHLVFKGTPKHPNIPQELTERGTRPNGTTWYDRTNYFETFAATEENLKWALDLEADRMVNSFIAKKDLDSEMTVVRNEFEAGENNPVGVLVERMLSTMYLWHNYGNSTIGAKADLENVPIDRLQAFYKNYYQPDNAVLLVAGKFDEAKTLALVNEYFSPIPKPARKLQNTYTLDPVQDGERSVTLRRVGDVQAAGASYHIPAGAHPDYAAVDVLSFILGDTPTGRLHKALVETKKAAQVFNFNLALREPGFLLLGAAVRTENSLDEARDILVRTVEGAVTEAPTKEEVERAKTAILKQIDLTLNDSERVGLEMSEWLAAGDWRLFFIHRDRIRNVTPEDVKRVATNYLKPSNRTVGQFIPTKQPDRAEIPATPDVMALVKDYKGSAAVAAGEAFDPSPANIEARTVRATTPGGLKLALVPKETRGDKVFATMTLRFGDEKSLMNRGTAGELAGAMLMRGTAKRTRQQIQDELDRLKARVNVGGGPTSANVSIETTRENLPAVLKLVAEVLREPSFPASEFEQLKNQQIAAAEEQRSEPQAIAIVNFRRHLSPYPKGDVRYVLTPDESIEAVKATTLDDVKKFYADFYGANNGEMAVVGDFDQKEVAKLVEDLFGGWKSKMPYARLGNTYRDIAAVNKSFETPDKANALFVAGLNLNVRDDDPDYPALVLGNYMLGGGFLNSRLATRIRQKEGISYGVGSQLSASPLDKAGSFMTFAIYAPQNVAKLEAAFKEEIERMLKEGFTAEELKAAKSGWLQSRQVSRAQDNELAGRLSSYLFLNRKLDFDAEFEKKVEALTPEQVASAMRKHIDAAKITIIKAGDFAKAGQKAVN
jgi:zinc protease